MEILCILHLASLIFGFPISTGGSFSAIIPGLIPTPFLRRFLCLLTVATAVALAVRSQGWTATVRDGKTAAVKTYTNELGQLAPPFADTKAFACQ